MSAVEYSGQCALPLSLSLSVCVCVCVCVCVYTHISILIYIFPAGTVRVGVSWHGCGNTVAHNEVYDAPQIGMIGGGVNMLFEDNDLHDLAKGTAAPYLPPSLPLALSLSLPHTNVRAHTQARQTLVGSMPAGRIACLPPRLPLRPPPRLIDGGVGDVNATAELGRTAETSSGGTSSDAFTK